MALSLTTLPAHLGAMESSKGVDTGIDVASGSRGYAQYDGLHSNGDVLWCFEGVEDYNPRRPQSLHPELHRQARAPTNMATTP